jgi:L-ascorbate metabolism protein UlaG (beta-lactamase superfamily)
MNLTEAVKAAKVICPKAVIPMHRFESSTEAYKKVESNTSIKVIPLDIGETYKI